MHVSCARQRRGCRGLDRLRTMVTMLGAARFRPWRALTSPGPKPKMQQALPPKTQCLLVSNATITAVGGVALLLPCGNRANAVLRPSASFYGWTSFARPFGLPALHCDGVWRH